MADEEKITLEETIEIEEVPSNSIESRKPRVPDKPVAKGKKQKPTIGQEVKEAIMGDDPRSVKSYLLWDVLLPAIKDTVVDLVTKGINALIYGEQRPNNARRDRGRSYIEYDKASYKYQPSRSQRRYSPPPPARRGMRFDDITFETRADAERVLDYLIDNTMQYGLTTVSDFYQLSGVEDTYIDQEYGWYELSRAYVDNVRGRFVIVLPRPERIEDD